MRKLFTLLALLAAVTFLPSRLPAQDTGNSGQENAPAATTATVTGCLQAGQKAGRFMLTADDGTVYHLRSKSVDLSEHVGHTVTVTGRVGQRRPQEGQAPSSSSSPEANAAGQSGEGQGGGHAHGHMLFVSDLKMVSDSCKK
ncbi:MAG: DUF5818 domain-containing protein [Candidatus Acidiferrales bacterium]